VGQTSAPAPSAARPLEPKRRGGKRRARRRPTPKPVAAPPEHEEVGERLRDAVEHHESSARLSGGDIDADWQRAQSSGEETVGGSAATPDQDVVDEIGEALGVEQAPDAPVMTSEEILRQRDLRYWRLERRVAEEEEEERP
jgi:hypothetical protein